MSSRTMSASLFTTVALAALGIAVWIGVAGAPERPEATDGAVALARAEVAGDLAAQRVPERVDGEAEIDDARSAPAPAAAEPELAPVAAEPEPAPVQAAPTAVPSPAINGLHVLCPLPGGGSAHLLLTSETYYRAETPAEIIRLTAIFGPPVTSIDPSVLPPKSAISVTEALDTAAAG
ncbi:MAG: hypothetical protein ACRDZO_06830 [Egibacteraceae bacterium]